MGADWKLLRKSYPDLPEEPTYEDVKRAVRDRHKDLTLRELADTREARDDARVKAERVTACIQAEVTVLDALILDRMDKEGVHKVHTGRGVTLRRDGTVDAKIDPDGGRDKLRKWIIENHQEELLSVHGQALSALVRRRLEEGQDLPDGVDAVPRNALRVSGRATKD